ncbi:MAG: hypothetical protein WAY93_01365 [Atopobiaceae bacterium]|jgi:hypothetical protein|nr:hypothetical protein [Atopobiaceae bacterium]
MRKSVRLTLAIAALSCALMLAGCGTAANSQSTSASSPAASTEKSIGEFKTLPNSQEEAMIGSSLVVFYFQSEGVVPGSGSLALHDASTGDVIETVTASQATQETDAFDDTAKNFTEWNSGTTIVTAFGNTTFEQGKSYYVTMDKDAWELSSDSSVKSKEVSDPKAISFSVEGYGMTEQSAPSTGPSPVGTPISLTVLLGGDATSAKISDYDASALQISQTEFSNSSTAFTVTPLKAGDQSFWISFSDKDGNGLKSASFVVTSS